MWVYFYKNTQILKSCGTICATNKGNRQIRPKVLVRQKKMTILLSIIIIIHQFHKFLGNNGIVAKLAIFCQNYVSFFTRSFYLLLKAVLAS